MQGPRGSGISSGTRWRERWSRESADVASDAGVGCVALSVGTCVLVQASVCARVCKCARATRAIACVRARACTCVWARVWVNTMRRESCGALRSVLLATDVAITHIVRDLGQEDAEQGARSDRMARGVVLHPCGLAVTVRIPTENTSSKIEV